MEPQPTPLAAQLAGMRAATTSNDGRGMLPAALHALIAAIFARIFDRLEQLLLLWQSGTLPQSKIQTPANRTQPSHLPARRHAPNPRHHAAHPSAPTPNSAKPRARITKPTLRAPDRPPILTPSPALIPHARPRPAHDPPSPGGQSVIKAPEPGLALARPY